MAVRTPVYWDSPSSSVREMSAAQITAITQRCVYLFGDATYRSVNLSYAISNGNLNAMTDTRDRAGGATSNASNFNNNSPGDTLDANVLTTYDLINQDISAGSAVSDTDNVLFPLYVDGTSGLRSMSINDMHDTFINDAIELLIDGNDRDGIYKLIVTTGDTSNTTIISPNVVFNDSRFREAIHGSATGTSNQNILPLSDTDLPDNITDHSRQWHLYRTNQGTAFGDPSVQVPLRLNTDGSISEYAYGDFSQILGELLHYRAGYESPYRIRYEITGTGAHPQSITDAVNTPVSTGGDAVTDTTLDSQVRINDQDGANTYRSQNLPTGSPETETTYELKIYRN